MHKPEKKPENNIVPPEGAQPPSAGQPQSAEEMIVLNKLFPDPNMKKLLKEVVESRKRNERFVKKIKSEVATEEEESE